MANSRLERIGSIYYRVEGLLRSGAMKREDRPIWWDIYRAFPPHREPLFHQPLKEEELKNIFYEEDIIRAKYHKSGLPLGAITMDDGTHKTNAQRFIDMYNTMKKESESSGSKNDLYEKCMEKFRNVLTQTKEDTSDEPVHENKSFVSMLKSSQKPETESVKPDIKKIFDE